MSVGLGWVKGKRVSSFSREESFNSDVGVAVALPPAGRLSWTWWQPHGGGGGGAAPTAAASEATTTMVKQWSTLE